jgi:hypothetical protein
MCSVNTLSVFVSGFFFVSFAYETFLGGAGSFLGGLSMFLGAALLGASTLAGPSSSTLFGLGFGVYLAVLLLMVANESPDVIAFCILG